MRSTITTDAWEQALMLFQKRHLIAHKLGVADQEYVNRSGDPDAVRGRKVQVTTSEVTELRKSLWSMAENLTTQFGGLTGGP